MLVFHFVATLTGTSLNSATLDVAGHSLPMIPTSTGFTVGFGSSVPFSLNLHVNAVQGTGWALIVTDQTGQQRTIIDTSTMAKGPQLTGTTGTGNRSDVDA